MAREWTQGPSGDWYTDGADGRQYSWHPLGGLKVHHAGETIRNTDRKAWDNLPSGLTDTATNAQIDERVDYFEGRFQVEGRFARLWS